MSFPSVEDINDIFPEDPTQPSVSLASSAGSPITLPWVKSESGKLITTLGTGCHSSKLQSDSAVTPFATQQALSASTLHGGIRFSNEVGSKSSFHKAITSDQAAHSEHLSVLGKLPAGCKFLNASASGTYNKSVLDNEDVGFPSRNTCAIETGAKIEQDLKASIQASIRTGVIYFDNPRLSLDAIADTRRSRRSLDYFSQKYGDYYVASLHLGADAGLLASISSKAHSESESLDLKIKLHVLWWDIEKSQHDEKQSRETFSKTKITAFETLNGSNANNIALNKSNVDNGVFSVPLSS